MGVDAFLDRVRAILRSGSPSAVAEAETETRRILDCELLAETETGIVSAYLGELLTMQARYGEAAQTFRQAFPLVTEPAQRLAVGVGWAEAINADNDHDDADSVRGALLKSLSDSSIQSSPDRACGLAWLARLTMNQNPQEALSLARDAVLLSKVNGKYRTETGLALAYTLRSVGNLDEAIIAAEEVVSFAKGTCLTEAQTLLAELYDEAGEDDQMDRVLSNAVEDVPLAFAQQYHRVLSVIHKMLKKRPERGTQMLGRLLLRTDPNKHPARKGGVHA